MARIVCYRSRKARLEAEREEISKPVQGLTQEDKRSLAKSRRDSENVALGPKRELFDTPKQITEF